MSIYFGPCTFVFCTGSFDIQNRHGILILLNRSAFLKNGAHRKDAPVRFSGPTPVPSAGATGQAGQAESAESIFLFSVDPD